MTDEQALKIAALVAALGRTRDDSKVPNDLQAAAMRMVCTPEESRDAVLMALGTMLEVSPMAQAVEALASLMTLCADLVIALANTPNAPKTRPELFRVLADAEERQAEKLQRMLGDLKALMAPPKGGNGESN